MKTLEINERMQIKLTDPEEARHVMLLGFAYSLWPDGSFGEYNKQLAGFMKDHLSMAKDDGKP
jgi:hypothetical protein